MGKSFIFERNLYSGQTKTCAAVIQVRYSRLCYCPKWAVNRDYAWLHIKLFAPVHDPDRGYSCTGFSVAVGDRSRIKRRKTV